MHSKGEKMSFGKTFYLWVIKLISFFSYKKTLKSNLIVIIVDFEDDINEFISYVDKENLINEYLIKIYYHPRIKGKLKVINNVEYIERKFSNKFKMIRYIQEALFIITDNYVVELGAIKLSPEKVCIQIWHANGALKKFGLASPYRYSTPDINRFKNVYKQYDKIVVGSRMMSKIFKDAFGIIEDDVLLKCGTLRTDKYFEQSSVSVKLEKALSHTKSKKVILYAPTYREWEHELKLNINEMNKLKTEGYTLIIRTHPAVKTTIPKEFNGFVVNGNDYYLDELLKVSDILITDYSSIAMEFSILKKPIYFFCYDMEHYREKTGLIDQFEDEVCSPIYKDTKTLQNAILDEVVQAEDVHIFNEKWNTYTSGNACASLVSYMELRKRKYETTI